jgi:EmrB/QacA subfamily drug resistance transporter
MQPPIAQSRRIWTLVIVSLGLFMTVLDNLVVNVALPSIHRDLGASIQTLEWTVNAYVLAYAVLLLTGAALGDRLGRKRMFMVGIAVFTAGSAAAALAPTISLLIAARAVQGVGAALVTPLTLTLLAEAFPPEQRGLALGVWSAISGIGVAAGPLVGGFLTQAASWHLIFWVNVPIGLALIPLARARLVESRGAVKHLDLPGLVLVSTGLFGLVFGLVRSQSLGWGSAEVLISLAAGVVLVLAFIAQELRTDEPMLPMEFFANRGFAVTNVPPERAPQHAAPGGRKAAGVDGRGDGRGAGGGLHVRALRQPAVHDRGPLAAGDRARLDGERGRRRRVLRQPGDPVRTGRQRNGARVRPLG